MIKRCMLIKNRMYILYYIDLNNMIAMLERKTVLLTIDFGMKVWSLSNGTYLCKVLGSSLGIPCQAQTTTPNP